MFSATVWLTRLKGQTGILAAALAASVLLISANARDKEPAFPLYVNVEQGGKPIGGLGASNFRVFLDGHGQEFALEIDEAPASVVLLVEHGNRSYRADIRSAITGLLEYAPKTFWYGLVTFDRDIHIVQDFSKGTSWLPEAFFEVPYPQWDDVATYDALTKTLDILSGVSGRRVIVFIGSGLDTFSTHSFGDVEKRLESTDVAFFSVGTGIAQNMDSTPYPGMLTELELLQTRSFLGTLADQTGGEWWFPVVDPAFRRAMERLFTDLSTQYKLVVKGTIPADGRFHKVKVDAFTITNDKRKDFKVRVREGFRRPAP